MMQFTWRYVDELIGKGLSLDVLGQFFWHMGVSLVPTSLPLAVLLASLITFGNMGEQLELLSMKAAGVPLVRIMLPVFLFVICLTGLSFFFQNKTAPEAQISLRTLLLSMKQAQPAVEIPEGVFYNDVPNLNLYVQRKNTETGMLYQVIIYKTDQGFDRAQIVLADSGRLEMTADKLHLKLDLWRGEQFENLQQQNQSALGSASVPYDRETFAYKQFIIDFDSNFSMMDKEMLRDMPSAKNMTQIEHSVDSMSRELDSVGHAYFLESKVRLYVPPRLSRPDSLALAKTQKLPFDTLVARISPECLLAARQSVFNTIRSTCTELEWKSVTTGNGDGLIRRHWVEWHQKMTLSLACLFFFFVGAPLGAIIRKGGLGMPAVISVLIFIFYYIINTSGMKLARDGTWNMVYGMWISSAVLVPFGAFLTYKANRDSVVFNIELYVSVMQRFLGLRSRRHIVRKEVIIDDPDYAGLSETLQELGNGCAEYARQSRLYQAPNYFRLFFKSRPDRRVEELSGRMEQLVETLSNSRDARVLALLNELPVIYVHAHVVPFSRKWLNVVSGLFFPLGLVLWLRIWRFRLRLLRDMRQVTRVCSQLGVVCRRLAGMEGAFDTDPVTSEETSGKTRRKGKRRQIAILLIAILTALLAGFYAERYFSGARRHAPVGAGQDRPKAAPSEPQAVPTDAPLRIDDRMLQQR